MSTSDSADNPATDVPRSLRVIIPLVLLAVLALAVIGIWHMERRKQAIIGMAKTEEDVRSELRQAYTLIRTGKCPEAQALLRQIDREMEVLRTGLPGDYAELKMARLMMEGEVEFVIGGLSNGASAEEKFTQALGLMTRASGEFWLFGVFGRGRVRYARGNYAGAVEDFTLLLDRNPNFGSAYYWRSRAWTGLGETDAAAEDAAKARRLDSWPPLRMFLPHKDSEERDLMW